jgi:hypothetical protein
MQPHTTTHSAARPSPPNAPDDAAVIAAVIAVARRDDALTVRRVAKRLRVPPQKAARCLRSPGLVDRVAALDVRAAELLDELLAKCDSHQAKKAQHPQEDRPILPQSMTYLRHAQANGLELPEDFYGVPDLPDQPTDTPAGSEEKIRVLTERYARREQLHHPRDSRQSILAIGGLLPWRRAAG